MCKNCSCSSCGNKILIDPTYFHWQLENKCVEYQVYLCQPCRDLTPRESWEYRGYKLPEPDQDKPYFIWKDIPGSIPRQGKFWCCTTYLCGYIDEIDDN